MTRGRPVTRNPTPGGLRPETHKHLLRLDHESHRLTYRRTHALVPALCADLAGVIAPPYDVIDPPAQERLYQASPYNVVRLTLGRQDPRDTEQDNRYTRAARDFTAWRAREVLRSDPTPALYLIEHTFVDGGQTRSRVGFISLLELHDSLTQAVHRHEATLEAPKEDRTKLLEAVQAQCCFCFRLRFAQSRQQHPRENRDDGDDDKQLYERESSVGAGTAPALEVGRNRHQLWHYLRFGNFGGNSASPAWKSKFEPLARRQGRVSLRIYERDFLAGCAFNRFKRCS